MTSKGAITKKKMSAETTISVLWCVGVLVSLIGFALFRDAMGSAFDGPSGFPLGLALIICVAGAVVLMVAIIATGVRLGSSR